MKYGVIADIHGNLEALNICLSYLKEIVSAYICAGDIVGYGPYPNECVEVVRRLSNFEGTIVISGNHDLAAVGLKEITWFNEDAKKAILWTEKVLSPENKEYIMSLSPRIDTPDFTVVHGSPRQPVDEYLIGESAMKENLSHFDTRICFVGHSHIPLLYDRTLHLLLDNEKIKLKNKHRVIVNFGSVGQPRDRNPRCSFGIYDDKTGEIMVKRLPYDISRTQEAMWKAGLPQFLIERLSFGI